MSGNGEDDSAVGLRLDALLSVPRVFGDPASAALGDTNLEIPCHAAGENADPLSQVLFEIEVRRPFKARWKRRGPQKAVELQMTDAVLLQRNFVGRRDNVQAALIKDDGIRLNLPLLRVSAQRLILGLQDAVCHDGPMNGVENSMLPLVTLRRQAADKKCLPIFLIVLPDGRRQFVLQLVPERLDRVPERRAG